MKKFFFTILVLQFFVLQFGYSQSWMRNRHELIIGGGITGVLTDLGGTPKIGSDPFSKRDWNIEATRPVISVGYRYRLNQFNALSTNLYAGMIAADDALSDNFVRNNRNAHFRSPLFELSTQYEFLFYHQQEGARFRLRGVRGFSRIDIQAYLFGGIGLFAFNPQAKYLDGKWYNLHDFSTEGQGIVATRPKYNRVQVAIPLGFGFRYGINRNWGIGLEYGMRKIFTDYLDDTSTTYFNLEVIRQHNMRNGNNPDIAAYFADPSKQPGQSMPGQQRGNPVDDDTYFFIMVKLYYNLFGQGLHIPKF